MQHGVGVLHADLKPENLLLCSKNRRDGTIKMIDFGCAVVIPDRTTDNDQAIAPFSPDKGEDTGTTGYWPPERFETTALSPAVDMWAVGVILYIMLTGAHPYDLDGDKSDEQMEEGIRTNPTAPLDDEYVSHLSESAIDLIRKLMHPDPQKRISAYEMLQHPWVRGETAATEKIEGSDTKLSQFQDLHNKLETSIFAALINRGHKDLTLSEAKITRKDSENHRSGANSIMKLVFDVFDEDGKGYITGDDVARQISETTGEVLSSKDTQAYMSFRKSSSGQDMSLSDFSKLFAGLKQRHFPRGHYIFHAGDPGKSMYFLSSGKVEIQTRKGQLVSILRSGDFFGEGSLLEHERDRFTSAKCATPVDVIEIKSEDFDRYIRSSSETRNELKRKWRARNLLYAKNLIRLQTNVKTRELKKGEVVYKEGEVGTSMFRVDDVDGGKSNLFVQTFILSRP